MPEGQATLIDSHVGARMQARRKELRISQTRLGEVLGVTYQQVQKYERGLHRVGAGALALAATFLDVPISYFYEGASTLISSIGLSDKQQESYARPAATQRSRWAEAFEAIPGENERELLLQLAGALSRRER